MPPTLCPRLASGSLLAPPTGNGLTSRKATSRGEPPLFQGVQEQAGAHGVQAATEGSAGRQSARPSRVVDQLTSWQAQDSGRSCKLAHSKTATRAHGCSVTYFWRKSLAVCCSKRYNKGQSSRSMTYLLGLVSQGRYVNERELVCFQQLSVILAKSCGAPVLYVILYETVTRTRT
jgi:hypothetical protein